jgi:hypothetical protein
LVVHPKMAKNEEINCQKKEGGWIFQLKKTLFGIIFSQ